MQLLRRHPRHVRVALPDRIHGSHDMVGVVQLQRGREVVEGIVAAPGLCHEAFHHFSHVGGHLAGDYGRGAAQTVGPLYILNLLPQHPLDPLLKALLVVRGQLVLGGLILRGRVQERLKILVGRVDGDQLFPLEIADLVDHKLVDLLCEQQHVPLPLREELHVRRGHGGGPVRRVEIVDILLGGGDPLQILRERHHLALVLLAALEAQELDDGLLVGPSVGGGVVQEAGFEVVGVPVVEGLVGLGLLAALLLEEAQESPDKRVRQLAHQSRVLHALTGDVQGHILAVHHPPQPEQPLGDDPVRVLLHQHPPGVELHPHLRILLEPPAGGVLGDVEHGLDGHGGVSGEFQGHQGLAVGGAAQEPEKLSVLILSGVALEPQRLGLIQLLHLLPLLHLQREGHKARILLGGLLDLTLARKLGGVALEVQDDLGAALETVHLRDREGPHAVALPDVAGAEAGVGGSGEDLHLVGHDKRGVEAHPELADDVAVGAGAPRRGVVHEIQGPTLGNGSELVDHLLAGHADACVCDGEDTPGFVCLNGDLQWHITVRNIRQPGLLQEPQLLTCITGVGNQLPDKDLLVGVQRLGNDVQQLPRLRLELHGLGLGGERPCVPDPPGQGPGCPPQRRQAPPGQP
mmetsp:Transcript_17170/g.41323  ORF Transcript_17170/g.41323 Transcript_17170/m.41323 type:complete len:632 (+) Transcript_17170:278-2173(+)